MFKKGDNVRCVYNDKGSDYVGCEGVVTRVRKNDPYPYIISVAGIVAFSCEELVATNGLIPVGTKFTTDFSPHRFNGSVLQVVSNTDTKNGIRYPYLAKVIKKGCGSESIGSIHSWNRVKNGDMIINSDNKNNKMAKIGIMMKKLLDKDTQALVKAGFIDGDLDITDEGEKALYALIFEDKKKALVELANEKLAEEKEECK